MRTTRREALQATFVGLTGAAFQPASAPPRSMIDFHAHWIAPKVVALLSARTSPRPPQGQGWFDVDARLKQMDQAGIERQVLSYVGAAYDGVMQPEEARPFWRAQNDDLGTVVKQHPARFSALATLPTANVAWAADELERAHRELGLIGATLPLDAFTSLAGARALAPIFAAAQKHRSHIFVHRGVASADIPGRQPEAGAANPYFGLAVPDPALPRAAAIPGDHVSARTLLMTAIHLATGVVTLALTDFLDPYPDVTVHVAMMGGAISSIAEQIQLAAEDGGQHDPAERLRRIYLDTGQSGRGPRGIALAAKVFGADRILFGTDSGPTATHAPTVASVNRTELTPEQKRQIFSDNARRILATKGIT